MTVHPRYIIERFGLQSIKDWVVEQQPNGDVILKSSEGMEMSVDPSYYTFAKDLLKHNSSWHDKHPQEIAIDMFGVNYGFFAYWTCSYHMLRVCRPMEDLGNTNAGSVVFGFMP